MMENNKNEICIVDGCNKMVLCKGYCQKHYDKLRNYGDAEHHTKNDKNIINIYEDHAEIILDNTDKVAIIDNNQINKIKNYKWWLDSNGYIKAIINNKTISLHRFLTNATENDEIDHKDRNKLNNKMENFRKVTRSKNCMNKGKQSNNTSGVVGVFWHKQHNKWYAKIGVKGKSIFLGLYNNLEEAKNIRIEAEKKYFKEFRSNANDNTNS